jgi:hypothetical protein
MNLKSLSSHLLIRETGSNRSNESKRVDEKEYKEISGCKNSCPE